MKTLILLATLLATQPALATSVRCGNDLITDSKREGISQYELAQKCGPSTYKDGNRVLYIKDNYTTIFVFDEVGRLDAIHKRF